MDFLYTADDYKKPSSTETGDYSIAKTLATMATGEEVSGDVNLNETVYKAWAALAPQEQADDYEVMKSAAANGNLALVEASVQSMQRRKALQEPVEQTQQRSYDMAREAAGNITERIVAASENVVINNSPEKLAAVTQEAAAAAASSALLEKQLKDGIKLSAFDYVKGVIGILSPLDVYAGRAVENVALENQSLTGISPDDITLMTTRNEVVNMFQNKYRSVPDEGKLQWLIDINNLLEQHPAITNFQRVGIVSEILQDEDLTIGGVGDWLDRLSGPLFALGALGGAVRISRGLKAASSLDGLAKTIAKAGGKEALENADTAKALSAMATKERVKAGALAVSEAVGVQAILDLSKLASVSIARVLPDAITTSAADIQKAVRAKANNTIEQLQEVLLAKTVDTQDVLAELDVLRKTYSNANNPNVFMADFRVADDGLSITGKVYYKPTEATRFLSPKAAQEFNERVLGGKGKVVEDTTNPGFLVEDDYVKSLETERALLAAQLAEKAKKAPRRASKAKTEAGERVGTGKGGKEPTEPPTALAVPAALKTSKPKYKTNELAFDDDIDKAAYQVGSKSKPSKSDLEVKAWLKAVTGWDDQKIAEHAVLVRNHIKGLPDTGEVVRVRKRNTVATASAKGGSGVGGVLDDSTAIHAFTKYTQEGNITYSNSIPSTIILPFIKNISKVLGMEKHRVAVLQLKDVVNDPQLAGILSLWKSMGSDVRALHVPTRYGSIIVMGKALEYTATNNASKLQGYLELFAHEYGHAFEFAFQFRYQDEIKALYTQWLRSKGIVTNNGHLSQVLPLEALFEYRLITDADSLVTKSNLEDWVGKYFGGDVAGYKAKEKEMHEWLANHHEFFAENFAKWALTSDIATTALGQAFAKIVAGLKTIATQVQQTLAKYVPGIRIGTAENVDKFMTDHTKRVQAGLVAARDLIPVAANAAKGMTPDVKSMRIRIGQIDEELAAISAARSGATHGFLIEKDVTSYLTFDKAGKYTDEDINSAVRNALGDWTLEAAEEAVKKRTVGVHTSSRYHKIFTDFLRAPLEKLNKKDHMMLDAALVRGDAAGEVFDQNTLSAMGLSKNAQEAYYTVRAARDMMYMVKNDTIAKTLTRKGYFDLNVSIPGVDERLFGKMVDASTMRGRIAYKVHDGKNVQVTDNWEEKSGDLILYELVRPVEINGKKHRTVAIRAGDVNAKQITTALPYRKGEYSRIYQDQYWVKVDTNFNVDGSPSLERLSHRTSATSKDAQAYVEAFNEAVALWQAGKLTKASGARLEAFGWDVATFADHLDKGKFGDTPKANVYYNRIDDDFDAGDTAMGGLLGSHRGEHIPNVFGNTNTASPLDSLAAEIGNTAYIASTMEWREAQVVKWFNTFKDDLPVYMHTMRPEEALAKVLAAPIDRATKHRQSIAYNTAKYLESQLGILTKEEELWLGFSRRMSEWMEGANSPKLDKVGAFMRENSDLTTPVRMLAFHSFMGAFNMKHLFMQGMNAFNAVVISPLHGMPAAKTGVLLGMALATNNDNAIRAFARMNNISNLGLGMDETEFVMTVNALKRSGLIDGIGHNTVWGAEGGKFGIFNGLTRRAGQMSALPFNTGEGYARIVSFDIARREWKEANVGKAWWTDDALEAIISRQDDLTQNMTAANRANWQRGIASIPTQFMQYFVKMLMNLGQGIARKNPRVFTGKEVRNLIIGHTAFLGVAGWGLVPEEWLNEVTKDLPESERVSLQQGLFAWGIYLASGGEAKVATGSSFGTFNFYKELYTDWVDNEAPWYSILTGPGGAAVGNWMGKIGYVSNIMATEGVSVEMAKDAFRELSSGFSSINNVQKALLAHRIDGTIRGRSGQQLYQLNHAQLGFEAIGIASIDKYELNNLIINDKKKKDYIKEVGNEVARHVMLALEAEKTGDKSQQLYHQNIVSTIMAAHRDDINTHKALWDAVFKSSKYGTRLERLLIEDMRYNFNDKMSVVQAYKDR